MQTTTHITVQTWSVEFLKRRSRQTRAQSQPRESHVDLARSSFIDEYSTTQLFSIKKVDSPLHNFLGSSTVMQDISLIFLKKSCQRNLPKNRKTVKGESRRHIPSQYRLVINLFTRLDTNLHFRIESFLWKPLLMKINLRCLRALVSKFFGALVTNSVASFSISFLSKVQN